MTASIYDIPVKKITGEDASLAEFKGKVLLVVNVASKCGLTPQYEGLERVYEQYKGQGLVIAGFPANDFKAQEPGTNEEIQSFCSLNYGVSFPMFAKITVNGADAHPLYRFLKEARPGVLGLESIKWNFTKFLVNKDGEPLKRYAPSDKPESLEVDVETVVASARPTV